MNPRRFLTGGLSTLVAVATIGLVPITARADTSPMTYHNGPVITNPLVYAVFWGPEWQNGFVDPTNTNYTGGQAITYITSMLHDMGGSAWLNTVTQYSGIHNPSNLYQNYWVDTSALPSSFSKSSVEGEAIAAADHFGLYNANIIWFIFTGPKKVPSDMGSDCGYHDYLIGSNQTYAYVPYQPTMANCYTHQVFNSSADDSFGHGQFDGFSITGGHELAEDLTDPYFDGWCRSPLTCTVFSSDEIGDLCQQSQGNSYGQTWLNNNNYYAVQGLWSNASASCALPTPQAPAPLPACNLATISANPANQATGRDANFFALSSGCATPQYQFQYFNSSGNLLSYQPYGLGWTAAWDPRVPGTYTIEVDARDASSSAAYEAKATITYQFVGCSSASLTVSNGPPAIVSAAASCPSTPTYQFWITPPGGVRGMVQDYSTSSSYVWNTNGLAAGSYALEVDVRDQSATSTEAIGRASYTVQSIPGGADFVGNVSADFNGDGFTDIAVMYNYGTDITGIWVWLGGANGSLQSPQRWWYGTSFDAGHAKIVAGDFNGDGYGDLAVIYNYGVGKTGIWIWYGPYSGFQHPTEPWYGTSFDWASSKLTAGDYNGDGYTDLGILYNYGGSTTGFWWWPGSPSGITTNVGLVWKYTTFAWAPSKVTSGDYNADGYDDLAILYNYGNGISGIWVWLGSSGGLQSTTTRWWYGSLDWNASKVISGDWNGSAPLHSPFGYSAFTVLYNFGSSTGIYVWQGFNGAGFTTAKALWWQKAGYDWNAMKVTAGNFNGDTTALNYVPYDDLAVLYNYGGSDSGLLVWLGAPGASLSDPGKKWESSSFAWTSSQIA